MGLTAELARSSCSTALAVRGVREVRGPERAAAACLMLGCVLSCRRVALVNWRTARDAAKAARQAEAATLQDAQATLQVMMWHCRPPAALSSIFCVGS